MPSIVEPATPASISANAVFLACNFQNKRVKRHFDGLKEKWEDTLPVRVYLSDKVRGEGARDLWTDITQAMREANLAIFDVTSFRPNVVLELGFSLALNRPKQVIICWDLTPSGKRPTRQEEWALSDIPHLYRIEYEAFNELDSQLLQHLERMAPVKNFYRFMKKIEQRKKTLSPKSYIAEALEVLKELRDNGPMRRREFTSRLYDRGVRADILGPLLTRFDLARPEPGRAGSWKLID